MAWTTCINARSSTETSKQQTCCWMKTARYEHAMDVGRCIMLAARAAGCNTVLTFAALVAAAANTAVSSHGRGLRLLTSDMLPW